MFAAARQIQAQEPAEKVTRLRRKNRSHQIVIVNDYSVGFLSREDKLD